MTWKGLTRNLQVVLIAGGAFVASRILRRHAAAHHRGGHADRILVEGRRTAMNLLVLYLLLLKASVTSFSGLGSLPMVRNDFVVERHLLTDHQLNMAVVAGRTGPGPYGLYLVCVAYLAAGMPGAFMGFLALVTPGISGDPADALDRSEGRHPACPGRDSRVTAGQRRPAGFFVRAPHAGRLHRRLLRGADGGELRGAHVHANRFGVADAGARPARGWRRACFH